MRSYAGRHIPPPDMGPALRRARLARGLSLRRLAARMHGSFGYLASLERGERSPSTSVAEELIRVLHMAGEDAAAVRRAAVAGAGRDSAWTMATWAALRADTGA